MSPLLHEDFLVFHGRQCFIDAALGPAWRRTEVIIEIDVAGFDRAAEARSVFHGAHRRPAQDLGGQVGNIRWPTS